MKRILTLLPVLLVVAVCLWLAWCQRVGSQPMGTGSPMFAKRWAARFEKWESPQEAERRSRRVGSLSLPDGTWFYAVCDGSHCNPNGGTVVIRDSSGAIRCFFGHVCIGDFQWLASSAACAGTNELLRSLSDLYAGLAELQFAEHMLTE